ITVVGAVKNDRVLCHRCFARGSIPTTSWCSTISPRTGGPSRHRSPRRKRLVHASLLARPQSHRALLVLRQRLATPPPAAHRAVTIDHISPEGRHFPVCGLCGRHGMIEAVEAAHEWPRGVFGRAVLGDARRTRRLVHLATAAADRPGPAPLSVVLISIDTLRADRMSLYGYGRDTTPSIDEWAKNATRFDRAYTGGPWTSLALSSMFRGVYPRRLEWTFLWETTRLRLLRRGEPTMPGERKVKVYATPIDDSHRTLS